MNENWKTWVTTFGAIASITLVAVTTCGPVFLDSGQEGERDTLFGEYQEFIPWQDRAEPSQEQAPVAEQVPVDPPAGMGFWVRFLDRDDRYVESNALVSAPGMWPFVSMKSETGGFLQLPDNQVHMLGGRTIQLYEVLIRSDEKAETPKAFWGVIRGPDKAVVAGDARTIRLRDAYPLEITVVDEDGEPIEGAFVRMSRDSVGLLHLNYTTEEDGVAVFRHIPEGVYYLTLDADNFSRHTVRVEHSDAGSTRNLQIVLEEGHGLRLPQSWRGPLVSDLAGSGQSSSDDADEVEEEEQEQDRPAEMVSLEVYAADDRGAGVEGAWLEAWVGSRRVAQARSGGTRPVFMDVPKGERVDIIATHAGWGEGSKSVFDVEGGDDVIVAITGDLLSAPEASDRIRGLSAIEAALGATLVEGDAKRWLVDRNPSGTIDTSGIERGDSLLFVRREGNRHRAVVERGRQIVEVTF